MRMKALETIMRAAIGAVLETAMRPGSWNICNAEEIQAGLAVSGK
jgi:hypothetical protein